MSAVSHFFPGLPKSGHWSKLIQGQTTQGLIWINLALEGDNANSVGREMSDSLKAKSINNAQTLYRLLLQLKNIALDNQVKLSLTAALKELNQWTFFAYHGSIGLKRGSQFHLLINEQQGRFAARTGQSRKGDLVFLLSENFSSYFNQLRALVKQESQKDIISQAKQLIEINLLPASAALLLLYLKSVPQPPVSSSVKKQRDWFNWLVNRWTHLWAYLKRIGEWLIQFVARINLPFVSYGAIKRFLTDNCQKVSRKLRNKKIILGLLIFFLALVSGLFFNRQLRLSNEKKQMTQVLRPFEQQLEQLKSAKTDQLLTTRQQTLALVDQLKILKTKYEDNARDLVLIERDLKQAETFLQSISGKKEIQSLPVYLDLSRFTADFVISKAAMQGDKLWLLDRQKKSLILYDQQTKKFVQKPLISLGSVKDLTVEDDRLLLLDHGIYSLIAQPGSNLVSLIKEDNINQTANLIAAFNRSIYIFSPTKDNIYHYSSDPTQPAKPWLKAILGGDSAQVVSWAIDGTIWLSTKSGQVNHYRSGRKIDFQLTGLEKKIKGPVYLTTSSQIKQLYLLVPEQNRVIAVDKQGHFIKEVKNFVLGSATQLIYDSKRKQVLAVSGAMIYQIPF